MKKKFILCLLLLLSLSGCTTKWEDIYVIFLSGGWAVYIVSIATLLLLLIRRKLKYRALLLVIGIPIFFIISIVFGVIEFGSGAEKTITELSIVVPLCIFLSTIGAIASGLLLLPTVFLYTFLLFLLFEWLGTERFEFIPYVIGTLYLVPSILSYYYLPESNFESVIFLFWGWHLVIFSAC